MERHEKKTGSVLIAGAGIGGMQAALDLADSGFLVHLVSKDPSIGGTMAMLDKTFPTGDCAMCMISPRMVEIGRHPNIRLHTLSEVVSVSGQPGNFTAVVKRKARYVDQAKCTGCGICEEKCPKKIVNEFEQSLAVRKAVYTLFAQAVPSTRVIDADNCLYLQKKRCGACEKYCTAGAINFSDTDREYDIPAGSIILSPGLARYDAGVRQELGYGRWPNVVSSIQFERILSASGPFQGTIQRPSDNKHPQRIAWIQCVGSRDPHNANPWCSSVCCMYATKQAVITKEHDRNTEVSIFYTDMRTFGKDFDRYVDKAKKEYGVLYRRAMISEVQEEPITKNLVLRWADDGHFFQEVFDMVVLSIGMQPQAGAMEFARIFGIRPNQYGFAKTSLFSPVETSRPGIYVAGTYQGPKDIPETVIQGSAAAASAMSLLGEVRGQEIKKPETYPEKDVKKDAPRIGVFVCHCGMNIARTVDVKNVAETAGKQDDVVHASTLLYACAPDGQKKIKEIIREKNLNRVVVASCTPRTHEKLFQDTIREAGLNKHLFELADIREQCSWCHMDQREEASRKATDIVKMNIAKARELAPINGKSVSITRTALIIGGGIAGMTAAISLAKQGFGVHIVEKTPHLGGLAAGLFNTIDGSDVQHFLRQQIKDVEAHPAIIKHTSSKIEKTRGYVGNFTSTLSDGTDINHGATIIASGGTEYIPSEYGYHEQKRVITQRELEKLLHQKKVPREGERFLMIQCVGSREEPDNYCSRICCLDAVKNAISIKKQAPHAQVIILCRDMRTYGLKEDYYTKARDLGVIFNKYLPESKPFVTSVPEELKVKVYDRLLQKEITFSTDYVILSAGLRPHPDGSRLAELFKLTRNRDNFFLEAHVKLRPVDFSSEGMFIAGLAHAPKNLDETISQALAAAGRAGILLSRDCLTVSGTTARHNREKCMSCLACFRACPYGSPFLDEEGRVSHNEIKCTGCGICAGLCPAKAFQVGGFQDDQINAMIDAI